MEQKFPFLRPHIAKAWQYTSQQGQILYEVTAAIRYFTKAK